MASRDRGADACAQRPDDDGADRGHEGAEPSCRAGVQSRSQRYPLGEAEAQEGSVTVRFQEVGDLRLGLKPKLQVAVCRVTVLLLKFPGAGPDFLLSLPRG